MSPFVKHERPGVLRACVSLLTMDASVKSVRAFTYLCLRIHPLPAASSIKHFAASCLGLTQEIPVCKKWLNYITDSLWVISWKRIYIPSQQNSAAVGSGWRVHERCWGKPRVKSPYVSSFCVCGWAEMEVSAKDTCLFCLYRGHVVLVFCSSWISLRGHLLLIEKIWTYLMCM